MISLGYLFKIQHCPNIITITVLLLLLYLSYFIYYYLDITKSLLLILQPITIPIDPFYSTCLKFRQIHL